MVLLGGSMAAPPRYEADWSDGLNMHSASEQQSSFAEQPRETLNTIPVVLTACDC